MALATCLKEKRRQRQKIREGNKNETGRNRIKTEGRKFQEKKGEEMEDLRKKKHKTADGIRSRLSWNFIQRGMAVLTDDSVPSSKVYQSLKIESIGCPETSLRKYYSTLRLVFQMGSDLIYFSAEDRHRHNRRNKFVNLYEIESQFISNVLTRTKRKEICPYT